MKRLWLSIRKKWANFKKEPFVVIVSEGGMTEDGYPFELDWNDLFIEDLAKHGIEGSSDEEAVQMWLQRIMRAEDLDNYQEALLEEANKQAKGD
jgi:hypothetical protein